MKKVIIVGSGIAGLSAGVYASKSGFETTIYEMHTIPGGNSTSWRREGYLFEGGMHWLTGSKPSLPLNKLWLETGAIDDQTAIYNRDPFFTYKGETEVFLYRDPDKLEAHFLAVSPQDGPLIKSLCNDVRKFLGMSMPVTDIKGVKVREKAKPPISMLFGMLGALGRMNALSSMSVGEYAARFKHPGIRALLSSVTGEDYAASSLLFTLGCLANGDGGYPEGGSLKMAHNMAKRCQELGCSINYGTRVERVEIENGRAVGVIIDGKLMEADAVIVASDTRCAIDTLFQTPLKEAWAEEMRKNTKPVACTFISLGVECDLRDVAENIVFPFDKPLELAGQQLTYGAINNYANFKGYAPQGCTALTTAILGDSYDYWKALKEKGEYAAAKERLAEGYIQRLEHALPQIKGKIAVVDVATPLTYERYCATYRGSWMTFMGKDTKQASYPQKSEAVQSLYFAGQRIQMPGGLPVAVYTGRTAVQHVCRDNDVLFG